MTTSTSRMRISVRSLALLDLFIMVISVVAITSRINLMLRLLADDPATIEEATGNAKEGADQRP